MQSSASRSSNTGGQTTMKVSTFPHRLTQGQQPPHSQEICPSPSNSMGSSQGSPPLLGSRSSSCSGGSFTTQVITPQNSLLQLRRTNSADCLKKSTLPPLRGVRTGAVFEVELDSPRWQISSATWLSNSFGDINLGSPLTSPTITQRPSLLRQGSDYFSRPFSDTENIGSGMSPPLIVSPLLSPWPRGTGEPQHPALGDRNAPFCLASYWKQGYLRDKRSLKRNLAYVDLTQVAQEAEERKRYMELYNKVIRRYQGLPTPILKGPAEPQLT